MNRSTHRIAVPLTLFLLLVTGTLTLLAQDAISADAIVPRLMNFSGKILNAQGKPFPGVSGVNFAIYKDQEGGTPLWMETQNVQADSSGRYTVQLGASKSTGLPADLFASGEARWLGVQVHGQAEQPRTLLLSVPYALKALDAETIGGLPASAFLKTSDPAVSTRASSTTAAITGTGKTNYVTKWTSATKLGDSNIFNGTGKVGIATTSPGATLDVNGSAIVRDNATVNGNFDAGSVSADTSVDGLTAVFGYSNSGIGTVGVSNGSDGVLGQGTTGVEGEGTSGYGVLGTVGSSGIDGLHGVTSSIYSGVAGLNTNSSSGYGVFGQAAGPSGVGGGFYNTSTGDALFAENLHSGSFAAFFLGNVDVDGNLSKAAGSFKIDHPLDPANKYLYHSFVESPDMMNIYNGNVTTDAAGTAVVTMPDWFEALNRDFRYQLTVMGQFAQAIVASKMSGHQFTIKTDKPNVEVSWQVTGVRQDAWANAHRIAVEEAKVGQERGRYLHPELFGASQNRSISALRHPSPILPSVKPVTRPKTATKAALN